MIQLRPAILVSLATSVKGGSTSERLDLDAHLEGASKVEKWQTTKTVFDPEEHRRAGETRKSIRRLFEGVARWTPFGLVVELEREAELREAVAQAEALAAEFNAGATHSRVKFSWLPARIDQGGNAADAVIAIRQEIGGLMEDLERASRAGEVESIRDISNRATSLGKLLAEGSPGTGQLGVAVEEARRVARAVVRRVEKAGERLEDVLTESNLAPVSAARFLFLGDEDVTEPETNVAPEGAGEEAN